MRAALGLGVAIIFIIVMVFSNFTPTETFPTKESTIDYAVDVSDENIESSFAAFKDINGGQSNTMLGKGIYHFATGLKHDFYSMFYIGGFVAEQYPWLMENSNTILILLVLILLVPIIPITFLIILAIILIIKDRFFGKKNKIHGVWKNG